MNSMVIPAVTAPRTTAAQKVRRGHQGRTRTHEREKDDAGQGQAQPAAPSGPIRSNNPTDKASPSWTHIIEPTDVKTPARGLFTLRAVLVAEVRHVTTSTVSQQIAALTREAGTPLLEHERRRVRLTPAGGSGRATSDVHLSIHEHEPDEALDLLAGDRVDLALTYDYELAPAVFDRTLVTQPLGRTEWSLGVPSAKRSAGRGTALEVFGQFHDHDWIVNSRNTADEEVVRTVASLAGFQPRVTHRADSLELGRT